MAETDAFKHSTPSLYDRYMGPLLFEPYATYVAKRIAPLRPERILETAAGTGIATRAVSEGVPEATIVEVGQSETWTVALAPGIYRYHCDIAPTDMKGTFTVTP